MRFLADENFPGDAVTALRTSGHDVLWIRTDAPGITDQVARWVAGELRYRTIPFAGARPGRCRQGHRRCSDVTRRLAPGHFSVVEPGRIRVRALPHPGRHSRREAGNRFGFCNSGDSRLPDLTTLA